MLSFLMTLCSMFIIRWQAPDIFYSYLKLLYSDSCSLHKSILGLPRSISSGKLFSIIIMAPQTLAPTIVRCGNITMLNEKERIGKSSLLRTQCVD